MLHLFEQPESIYRLFMYHQGTINFFSFLNNPHAITSRKRRKNVANLIGETPNKCYKRIKLQIKHLHKRTSL